MDEEKARGRMRADWWILCGDCGRDEYLDSFEARQVGGLVALAKTLKWKMTKRRGWLCPDCAARVADLFPRRGLSRAGETTIQDFIIPARIFFEEWLQVNPILSDDDKEEAARNIAHDVQVSLPYHHSDLDELAVEHPEWRTSDIDTNDPYMHIQHNAGEAIFLELLSMWDKDD